MRPLRTNPYSLLMRTGSQEDLLSFPLSLSPLLFSLALAALRVPACISCLCVRFFPLLNFIVVNYVWEGCASKQDPASAVPLPPFPATPAHSAVRGECQREHSRGSLMTPIPLCATLLISSMILADGTWAAD